jgi:hypothetical protein
VADADDPSLLVDVLGPELSTEIVPQGVTVEGHVTECGQGASAEAFKAARRSDRANSIRVR